MFKLVKIINSGTNQPEPRHITAAAGTVYTRGTLTALSMGLPLGVRETEKPTYLIGESMKEDEKRTILCYPINENMVFETQITEIPTDLYVGDKVTLHTDGGYATGVTATTDSGVCEIYDLAGATNEGDTVYVRIV